VDGDADGRDPARGDRAACDRVEPAVVLDPQDRDLVAAGVDGEEVPPVVRDL